jgi:hypothetical protein
MALARYALLSASPQALPVNAPSTLPRQAPQCHRHALTAQNPYTRCLNDLKRSEGPRHSLPIMPLLAARLIDYATIQGAQSIG